MRFLIFELKQKWDHYSDLKFHEESDGDSPQVQKLEPNIIGFSRDFKGARGYKLCFCDCTYIDR